MVPCQADTTKRTILYIKGEPFRTISSSELLAVTVAIMVFGPESAWRKGSGRVSVTGFTDNLSNAYLIDRFLTTKFPASLVLMELSKQLDKYSLDLDLAWIPREQNEASDDLSKGVRKVQHGKPNGGKLRADELSSASGPPGCGCFP